MFLVTVIFKRDRGPVSCEADSKHAVFFGGEVPEYSHVAGGDLFWGFKHNLRGYLGFMSRAHSGRHQRLRPLGRDSARGDSPVLLRVHVRG